MAPLQALLLVGPARLGEKVEVTITAGTTMTSDETGAFLQVSGPGRSAIEGPDGLEALTEVVATLAASDPEAAAMVNSVGTPDYTVVGPRARSAATVAELDAVGGLLSPDVALADLLLNPTASTVVLTVPDDSRIAGTCRSGLIALAALPDVKLAVRTNATAVRNAEPC